MGFFDDLFAFARRPPQLPALASSRFTDGTRMDSSSVVNPLTGLGGLNDKGAVGRPNALVVPLADQELEALYLHNGMARKLIDIFPARATRQGWSVGDIVPPRIEKYLRVHQNVREATTWSQLYGGCAMVLVTEDDVPAGFSGSPRAWLKEPLDLKRVGKLHALQVFDSRSATPAEWDDDIRSPNYRMPRIWSISDDGFDAEIHHSRVCHFRGSRRPPGLRRNGFGTSFSTFPDVSFLQHLWDSIRGFTETMNGGASLAAELKHAVMKIGDLGTVLTGSQADAFKDRIRLSQLSLSQLGIMLLGPNDEYEQRTTPPSGFGELSDAAKSVLSAVSNIPQQELWGDTPSGLNTDGESGKEGFNAAISDFQESHRDPIEQIYRVLLCSQDGPTQGVEPPDWELRFEPLGEPTELTQAQLRQIVAQTDAELIDSGLVSAEHIRRHRYGTDGWSFEIPGMDEQELQGLELEARARKELEQMQAMNPMGPMGPDAEGDDGGSMAAPPGGPPAGGAPVPDPTDRQALA